MTTAATTRRNVPSGWTLLRIGRGRSNANRSTSSEVWFCP